MSLFSEDVRKGFEDALRSNHQGILEEAADRHPFFKGMSACDLVLMGWNGRAKHDVKNQLWSAVIGSYRHGPRGFWGPVILQMLSPAVLRRAARVLAEGTHANLAEDTAHQLVAAVLSAAATETLPTPARWIPNRLATRAATRVGRWIEVEIDSRCEYLADVPEPEAAPDRDVTIFDSMLARLKTLGVPRATAILLYRNRILGEPLPRIAQELGTTAEALRMRRFRAEERIRRRRLAA